MYWQIGILVLFVWSRSSTFSLSLSSFSFFCFDGDWNVIDCKSVAAAATKQHHQFHYEMMTFCSITAGRNWITRTRADGVCIQFIYIFSLVAIARCHFSSVSIGFIFILFHILSSLTVNVCVFLPSFILFSLTLTETAADGRNKMVQLVHTHQIRADFCFVYLLVQFHLIDKCNRIDISHWC